MQAQIECEGQQVRAWRGVEPCVVRFQHAEGAPVTWIKARITYSWLARDRMHVV